MRKRFYRVRRFLGALALAAVLSAAGGTIVQAASLPEDIGAGERDERSILEDADFASDIAYQRTRSLHLSYGYVEISKVDYDRVQILGTTQCHHECPVVHLYLYLDKMDPKTKKIENSIREFEFDEKKVGHLTKSLGLLVDDGYYYSVRGYHCAEHGDVMESTNTMTNWVYIGKTDEPVN